jgi:hypothetical protein
MFLKIDLFFVEDMDFLNVATFKNILCIPIMANFIHIHFRVYKAFSFEIFDIFDKSVPTVASLAVFSETTKAVN